MLDITVADIPAISTTAEHYASRTFQALYQAVKFDGMPAMWGVTFNGDHVDIQYSSDRTEDVNDWARLFGAEAALEGPTHGFGVGAWRCYRVKGTLDGVALEVWCPSTVDRQDVAP